tara:strand:- start:259 stop:1134 length:876 start_codon:yes stop_codon:yes gene_type:complete
MMQEVPYEEYKKYLDKKRKCIICQEYTTSKIWAKDSYFNAIECNSCGMVSIDPPLTEEGLSLYYQKNFSRREDAKKKWNKRLKQYEQDKKFIENFITSGKCLDVGCGGGLFLESLNKNFTKYGIDIDNTSIKYAKDNFNSDYRVESLGEDSFNYNSLDLIIMRGVIEHVLDPNLYVKRCSELLVKGGYVFICATPNISSFTAKFYKQRWNLWHPIQHINLFDENTLTLLFEKYGFEKKIITYPYINTPYEDLEKDYQELEKDLINIFQGKNIDRISPPFWGNMISVIYIKK